MMFRKVSVFVLVVAFHLLVLGVVYLSTREPGHEVIEKPAVEETENAQSATVEATGNETSSGTAGVVQQQTQTSKPRVPQSSQRVHVVEKGDFLGKIARDYNVSAKDIMTLNNISNPNKIQLGQKIKIPAK